MEKRHRRSTDLQTHQNAVHLSAESATEENLGKVQKSEADPTLTKSSATHSHSISDPELSIRRRHQNMERDTAGTLQPPKNVNIPQNTCDSTLPPAGVRSSTMRYAPHPLLVRLVTELADSASCAEITLLTDFRPSRSGADGETALSSRPSTSQWLAVEKIIDSDSAVQHSMDDICRTVARYTHAQSKKIPRQDCVEFGRRHIPQNDRMMREMGIWVVYERKQCTKRGCVKCPKLDCGVCPHVLRCNCPDKCAATKWCAHIHVASVKESWLTFDASACLLIHQSWQRMRVRHLQAVCREPQPMVKFSNRMYRERQTHANWLRPRRVDVVGKAACDCFRYRICSMCGACRCQFVCNCFDYEFNEKVCEHCHSVALTFPRNRRQLFTRQFSFEYASDDDDGQPTVVASRGESRTQAEHERSYHIKRSQIKVWLPYLWSVEGAAGGCKFMYLVLFRAYYRRWCSCKKFDDEAEKRCLKCKICVHRYLCTCDAPDSGEEQYVCRHIHAVRRMCDAGEAFPEGYESDQVDYNNCEGDVEEAVQHFMEERQRSQSVPDSQIRHFSDLSSS